MNEERWDYKIDGRQHGAARIALCLVLSVVFTVLTVDQLQLRPNQSLIVALSFGSLAAVSLCFLTMLLIRFYCFKVYLGASGFYFQSTPFNGHFYEYRSIASCREEMKTSHYRAGTDKQYAYFFTFTELSGRSTKFLFEKSVFEREISVLKKRIEAK